MKHVSLEQFSDLHDLMTITQSIDSGFAITHIEGQPTILITTCSGAGDCYVIQ